MKLPLRLLPLSLLALCFNASAVWEYSLSAKLALYDAAASVCRPFAPQEVDETLNVFYRGLSPDEKAHIDEARATAEYKETFDGARKEATEMVLARKGKEREACTKLLRQ